MFGCTCLNTNIEYENDAGCAHSSSDKAVVHKRGVFYQP